MYQKNFLFLFLLYVSLIRGNNSENWQRRPGPGFRPGNPSVTLRYFSFNIKTLVGLKNKFFLISRLFYVLCTNMFLNM